MSAVTSVSHSPGNSVSNCFWTILGRFFGHRAGLWPRISKKSSSISLLDSDTENFGLSFCFSFSFSPLGLGDFAVSVLNEDGLLNLLSSIFNPLVAGTEFPPLGALNAALLVLRFHGINPGSISKTIAAAADDVVFLGR
uniref:Uncharacterized protein n=1 Tax=Rhizophora mucronata TaxID=61149 RepID=A0A2P2NQE7_RHIMU